MALEDLKKDELVRLAEEFGGVDTDGTKAEIIERLYDAGYEHPADGQETEPEAEPEADDTAVEAQQEEQAEQEAEAAAEADEDDRVLVLMTKPARMHQLHGYTFTRQHPFVAVAKQDVEKIVAVPGFRVADYREAEEYYS